MKKVFMSLAVVALMAAAVSCGCNNTKAAEEPAEEAIEAVEDTCAACCDSCAAAAEEVVEAVAE
ncbi:MAG: hypothetical protein J6T02_00210 [Bacteroidales bacterium]|nr:hypothetical protein [Bacteroidales bacterium]